jgi:hypothetical protein
MDILGKRLRDEIVALRKSIDAIRDQQERYHQEQQAQRELPHPLIGVKAEIHEEPDAERESNSYRKKTLRVQWITAFATSAAFIAAAIYAGVASQQLRQMRHANELAKQANEQTLKIANRQYEFGQKQLIYTQAAQIDIQLNFQPGKLEPNQGPQLPAISFYLRNVGHETATNVRGVFAVRELTVDKEHAVRVITIKTVAVPYPMRAFSDFPNAMVGPFMHNDNYFFDVPDSEAQLLRNADRFIEVKGPLEYWDGFQKKTWPVCYRWVGYVPKNSSYSNFTFQPCDEYRSSLESVLQLKRQDKR